MTDFRGIVLEGPPPASDGLPDITEGPGIVCPSPLFGEACPSCVFTGIDEIRVGFCEGPPLCAEGCTCVVENALDTGRQLLGGGSAGLLAGAGAVEVSPLVVALRVDVVECRRSGGGGVGGGVVTLRRDAVSDSGREIFGILGVLSSFKRSLGLNNIARAANVRACRKVNK